MKKLITLCLALAGLMGTVNAENVTKRIYVITDVSFQAYQGQGLAIHAWYTGGGDIYAQGNVNEKMNIYGGFNPGDKKGLWYKDITFDDGGTIQFFVYKYGDTGWHSSDATQQVLTPSSEMTYYLWDSYNNGDLTNSYIPVNFYAYLYDGVSEWTQVELTKENYYTYTTTIDNQTSFNSKLELLIAPSFAFKEDFEDGKWDMMYRPFYENQNVGFSNQTYFDGGYYANNSNSLKLNAEAKYELTFYPIAYQYSLAPYFNRTINSSLKFATFSSAYDVTIPEGVDAYYASNVTDGKVVMTKNTTGKIAAEDGALLSGSGEVKFVPAEGATAMSGNLLHASVVDTDVDESIPGKYHYFLAGSSAADLGFYNLASPATSKAGKAYLETTTALANESSSDPSSGARAAWVFEDGTQGISDATRTALTTDAVYDLQGRVAKTAKAGLYIKNGKKIIVK